ncbi:MAG: 50S ribosomal protein L11 methyltransferase [Bacteroidia bacterium]|nr:50S ribosomal protein L11 methyltransferase [Bacteroidia bacterium]
MFYTRLQVTCDPEFTEILIAEFAEASFDTFMETENGFEAFVEEEKFDHILLKEIEKKYKHVNPLVFSQDKIQKQNWNEEWERSIDPIIVDNKCLVRAEFHKIDNLPAGRQGKYPYEIVITPKMSFGTGHHQTTYLMLKSQMKMEHRGKRVMDAGCGTAILSIMASKLGATVVEAFDIDEWSTVNGEENIENNNCGNVHLYQGMISELKFDGLFDIILANINKNVLLAEMKSYADFLNSKGQLLLSGFYATDIDDLKYEASKYGLGEVFRDEKETWASLLLQKK